MDMTAVPESEQGRVIDAMLVVKQWCEANGWEGLDIGDAIAMPLPDGRIMLAYGAVAFAVGEVGEDEVVKARLIDEGWEYAYFTPTGKLVKTVVRHR